MSSNIGLTHFLILSAMVFTIGICGIFINRKNILTVLMSIELTLLAVSINFVAFSAHLHDLTGQIFTILILAVTAAEAAVGLAILITYYRTKGDIEVSEMKRLKG